MEGNLAFIVGHPVKGRSRTHRMQFGAGGAARQSTPLSSAADAVHDPVFSPQLIEAIRRSHDPSTRIPVIRSGSLRLHRPAARAPRDTRTP